MARIKEPEIMKLLTSDNWQGFSVCNTAKNMNWAYKLLGWKDYGRESRRAKGC